MVSIQMALDEGWLTKKGSKWQTIPELMLRYRCASFFGRLYAPELLMGLQTTEEVMDFIDATPDGTGSFAVNLADLQDKAAPPLPDSEVAEETQDVETEDGRTEAADGGQQQSAKPDAAEAEQEAQEDAEPADTSNLQFE